MTNNSTTTAAARSGGRRIQVVLVGMAMTLLAAISLSAWAGPMGMHGGRHGGGMGFGSPERMARGIDRMLDGLNASDAQRAQIKQIAGAAATDLKAQSAARRALRERGVQALTGPNVDAGAAEQVRQQMLQQHDQSSRRLTQAMVDIARVLTPEQRARVGERMRDRAARMEERMKRMEREAPRR